MTTSSVGHPELDVTRDLLVAVPGAAPGRNRAPLYYDELLAAAARHERSDPRSRGIWHEVLTSVRLTSLALQLEASTQDSGAQAVTVAYALSAGRRSSVALQRRLRRDHRRVGRTVGVRYPLRAGMPVERTSLRLCGLLLGASPADLELLDATLATHNEALEQWRGTLVHQVRAASSSAIPGPRRSD
jgi:hypothetical protein